MARKTKIIVATVLVAVLVLVASGLAAYHSLTNPKVEAKPTLSGSLSAVVSEKDQPRYIAHRGFSAVAPENSLPALAKAGEAGFWGAEFDIQRTKDGVWVLSHDANIKRMTDGRGTIQKMTYEQLQGYTFDNGANIADYEGLRIPTLAQALDECAKYDLIPCVELKKENGLEGIETVIKTLREKGAAETCVILSFSYEQLERVHALAPEIRLWYLSSQVTDDALQKCKTLGAGLDFKLGDKKNTDERLRAWQESGVEGGAWTIDTIEALDKAYQWGVRYITTNAITPAK